MIPCTKRWLADGLHAGRFLGSKMAKQSRLTLADIEAIIEISHTGPAAPAPAPDAAQQPARGFVGALAFAGAAEQRSLGCDRGYHVRAGICEGRRGFGFGFPGRRLAESIRGHLERTAAIRLHHVAGLRAQSATASRWPTNLDHLPCAQFPSQTHPSRRA